LASRPGPTYAGEPQNRGMGGAVDMGHSALAAA
jgi:hypothetical protein